MVSEGLYDTDDWSNDCWIININININNFISVLTDNFSQNK